MMQSAFQDAYPDDYAHCYGCGRLNEHGLQIKSYWDGEESICHFQPQPYHTGGFPDFLYGGMIASLIDCHGAGTASAVRHKLDMNEKGEATPQRFVTASLHVDYLKPTPVNQLLELKGRVKEIKGRKIIIAVDLFAKDQLCAKGEVVAVQIPEDYHEKVHT